MTTRIFRAIRAPVYGRAAHRHRLVPGLAQPRERPVRVPPRGRGQPLLLDCGPGVLGRLRELRIAPDSIAITHFHLDHWGDLVPWAWLNAYGPPDHRLVCDLWLPPRGAETLALFAGRFGNDRMFDDAFELREYEPDVPFTTVGFEVEACRLPHYTLTSFGFRVSRNGKTLAYSGDSAPDAASSPSWRRGADLFLCEATLSGREQGRRAARPPVGRRGARRRRRAHPPHPSAGRATPRRTACRSPSTGSRSRSRGRVTRSGATVPGHPGRGKIDRTGPNSLSFPHFRLGFDPLLPRSDAL